MNKFDRKELEKEMFFDPLNRWYVGRLNLFNLVKPHGMSRLERYSYGRI